jgi:hypothetical protein
MLRASITAAPKRPTFGWRTSVASGAVGGEHAPPKKVPLPTLELETMPAWSVPISEASRLSAGEPASYRALLDVPRGLPEELSRTPLETETEPRKIRPCPIDRPEPRIRIEPGTYDQQAGH